MQPTRPTLKIHQFYHDEIYWIKVCALATPSQKLALHGIRYKGATPRTQKQKALVVEFHKVITGDTRAYNQVLVDLLSIPE